MWVCKPFQILKGKEKQTLDNLKLIFFSKSVQQIEDVIFCQYCCMSMQIQRVKKKNDYDELHSL